MQYVTRQTPRRRHLDVVSLAFLAEPSAAVATDSEILGSITLRAKRVTRNIKRIDVQPYDAWLGFGIAQLTMPVVGDFDTNAILHPGWLVYITESGTGSDVAVYGDNTAISEHSKPVKIDRYGNTPSMWVDSSKTYDMTIKNEFGVSRYSVSGLTP